MNYYIGNTILISETSVQFTTKFYGNTIVDKHVNYSGGLVLHHNAAYGTVLLDEQAVDVGCHELGYMGGGQVLAHFSNRGSTNWGLTNISCNGNEQHIRNCHLPADMKLQFSAIIEQNVRCYDNSSEKG